MKQERSDEMKIENNSGKKQSRRIKKALKEEKEENERQKETETARELYFLFSCLSKP